MKFYWFILNCPISCIKIFMTWYWSEYLARYWFNTSYSLWKESGSLLKNSFCRFATDKHSVASKLQYLCIKWLKSTSLISIVNFLNNFLLYQSPQGPCYRKRYSFFGETVSESETKEKVCLYLAEKFRNPLDAIGNGKVVCRQNKCPSYYE